MKNIYEKINEQKEQMKLKVQNLFTKLRNQLNKREDELLLKIDGDGNKEEENDEEIKPKKKKKKKKIKTKTKKMLEIYILEN